MKITFILASANIGGGTKVIAMYAKLLIERGHQVTLVSAGKRGVGVKQRIKYFLLGNKINLDGYFSLEYFDFLNIPIKVVETYRPIVNEDLPDADVVISTFWVTAEWVKNLSDCKGRKVSFLQGFEISPECSDERNKGIIKSWEMPFFKIVVSNWLLKIAKERFGDEAARLVFNGIDCECFSSKRRTKQKKPTVGFLFADNWFKSPEIYVELVLQLQKIKKDIKFIAFGACMAEDLPESVDYKYKPEQSEIGGIYASCDVWVCCSRQEGFGLPILEAMANRTPVVSTNVGAATDLIRPGVNGYIVNIEDLEAMSNQVINLLNMPEDKWASFSEQAYVTSKKNTVERAVIEFENALFLAIV